MVLAKVAEEAGPPSPTFKCDVCEDDEHPADATHWCPDCKGFMCANCVQSHSTNRMLKKHSLQTIEHHTASGGSGGGGGLSAHQGCAKHDGNPFGFFCSTCMVLLCTSCAILDHPKGDSHDVGDLATMVARFTRLLATAAAPLEQQSVALEQAMAMVEAVKGSIAQYKQAADGAVKSAAADMRRAAVRFEKRGLAASKAVADQKEAVLNEQVATLEEALRRGARAAPALRLVLRARRRGPRRPHRAGAGWAKAPPVRGRSEPHGAPHAGGDDHAAAWAGAACGARAPVGAAGDGQPAVRWQAGGGDRRDRRAWGSGGPRCGGGQLHCDRCGG
jgi:hypothetical protein